MSNTFSEIRSKQNVLDRVPTRPFNKHQWRWCPSDCPPWHTRCRSIACIALRHHPVYRSRCSGWWWTSWCMRWVECRSCSHCNANRCSWNGRLPTRDMRRRDAHTMRHDALLLCHRWWRERIPTLPWVPSCMWRCCRWFGRAMCTSLVDGWCSRRMMMSWCQMLRVAQQLWLAIAWQPSLERGWERMFAWETRGHNGGRPASRAATRNTAERIHMPFIVVGGVIELVLKRLMLVGRILCLFIATGSWRGAAIVFGGVRGDWISSYTHDWNLNAVKLSGLTRLAFQSSEASYTRRGCFCSLQMG